MSRLPKLFLSGLAGVLLGTLPGFVAWGSEGTTSVSQKLSPTVDVRFYSRSLRSGNLSDGHKVTFSPGLELGSLSKPNSLAADLPDLKVDGESVSGASPLRVKSDRIIFVTGGTTQFHFSPKVHAETGVGYVRRDLLPPDVTRQETYSVPLTLYYQVSPRVATSIGYRFRQSRLVTPGSMKLQDHTLNLGISAALMPDLVGQVSVGASNERNLVTPAGHFPVNGEAQILWKAHPDSTYMFTITRDYSMGLNPHELLRHDKVGLRAKFSLSELWSAAVGAVFRTSLTSSAPHQESKSAELRFDFSAKALVTMSAGYVFQLSSPGDQPNIETDGHGLNLSATLHY